MVQVIINPMNLIQSQVKECTPHSAKCISEACVMRYFPELLTTCIFIVLCLLGCVHTYTGKGEEVLFNEALSLLQLLCRKLIKSM